MTSSLWQWQSQNSASYLTCDLLDRWPHGFFSRSSWPAKPETLTQVLAPASPAFRLKQIHGNRIWAADALTPIHQASDNPVLEEGDGLWSMPRDDRPSLWVSTADCTPVLLGDPVTGQVAALHAGWRGTAAQIVAQAVAQLQAGGASVSDLRVALGPAIDGAVYQVDQRVAIQVCQSVTPIPLTPDNVEETIGLGEQSPLKPDPNPGKVRLDVRLVNRWQLINLGVPAAHIAIAPHCTYQDEQHFFSYRRTGEKYVQWSGIVAVA